MKFIKIIYKFNKINSKIKIIKDINNTQFKFKVIQNLLNLFKINIKIYLV